MSVRGRAGHGERHRRTDSVGAGVQPGARVGVRRDGRPGVTTRCALVAVTLLGACVPSAVVFAQSPTPRARVGSATPASRCTELTASPSTLMQAPEGRALLRFKRELDNAAELMAQRTDSARGAETRPINDAQRGIDSLMQIVVRFAKDGALDGPSFIVRRGDSLHVTSGGHNFDSRTFFDSVNAERGRFAPQMEAEIRAFAPQLQRSIRSMQPQIAAIVLDARTRMQGKVITTTGWLGMHLSESKITMVSPQGALTNYCDYPVIESVDAGSPAETAGLISGDTVLAYNGRDVRAQAVNYAELLVPGQQLRMRVKRAGKSRELAVLVGARPQLERTITLMPAPCPPGASCDRVTSFSFTSPPSTSFPPSMAPTIAPSAMLPPPLPGDPMLASSGIAVLVGAQLTTIDEEFAQSLGVEPGVLVLRAPAGSIAAEAGLRAGDVIRAVNGRPVRDLAVLQRAFTAFGPHDLRLTVSAKGNAARTVWLKW